MGVLKAPAQSNAAVDRTPTFIFTGGIRSLCDSVVRWDCFSTSILLLRCYRRYGSRDTSLYPFPEFETSGASSTELRVDRAPTSRLSLHHGRDTSQRPFDAGYQEERNPHVQIVPPLTRESPIEWFIFNAVVLAVRLVSV